MAIGFNINPDKAKAAVAAVEPGEALSDIDELCMAVMAQDRQRHGNAAFAAAVDLTNLLAQKYGLMGGAYS